MNSLKMLFYLSLTYSGIDVKMIPYPIWVEWVWNQVYLQKNRRSWWINSPTLC